MKIGPNVSQVHGKPAWPGHNDVWGVFLTKWRPEDPFDEMRVPSNQVGALSVDLETLDKVKVPFWPDMVPL